MEKTVSEKIAEYALSLTLEQVPPRVLAYGKLLLLDTLGVAMANLDQEHAQVVHRVVTEINGNQGCTLWGEKRKETGDPAQKAGSKERAEKRTRQREKIR